ncbi:MAG: histidine phosphatase family protein [Acetobacter sp.]|uniref:histidine phosphatase family protein n=1 Tax=Acetobacter sp. TaxID=440 RepID=UPI0039E9E5DA
MRGAAPRHDPARSHNPLRVLRRRNALPCQYRMLVHDPAAHPAPSPTPNSPAWGAGWLPVPALSGAGHEGKSPTPRPARMKLVCIASGLPDDIRRGVIPPTGSSGNAEAGIATWLDTADHGRALIMAPDAWPAGTRPRSGLPVVTEPDLRERDYGTWHGRHLRDLPPDALRRWIDDPQFAPPGGESGQAAFERVGHCLARLPCDAGHCTVLARPTVIKLLLIHALGGGADMVAHIDVPPASRSEITRLTGWRVCAMGVPLG